MVLFLVCSLALTSCSLAADAGDEMAQLSEPAPQISLPDLDGNQVSLSDHLGEVVLLNYWNLGCPPCLDEFPTFEEIHAEYRDRGLVIIAIHVGGPTREVAEFAQAGPYTFTILVDEAVAVAPPLPTTYVIDREGFVQHRWIGGPLEESEILAQVEPYLSTGE